MPALVALAPPSVSPREPAPVSLEDLATVFYYSAGVTRRRNYPGGEVLFRAAACTGALYEIELYAVCGNLDRLPAGVYHFNPRDFALRRLRDGDFRGALVQATAAEEGVTRAPVTLVSTGTYWRNAWKYRARTYRHFGWDNGTLLANLLAVAAARGIEARVVHGFVDRTVNALLGLDAAREVALNLVPLGRTAAPIEARADAPAALELATIPYSRREIDYPAMRELHEASSLETPDEVARWRAARARSATPSEGREGLVLAAPGAGAIPADGVADVIRRRGSSRRFARRAVPLESLAITLLGATRGIAADFLAPGEQLNDLFLVAHAVDGLAPGAYALRRDSLRLEPLRLGDFRAETGYLGLEQALPADASAAVFFLADLHAILERFGNRGYRAAQLEAGILGGRLYLAQYAQRLGATGLTFYDDDVVRFFAPASGNRSAIFLVALGKSEKILYGI
jgi:SagB-type dehydrogenase family enzyme